MFDLVRLISFWGGVILTGLTYYALFANTKLAERIPASQHVSWLAYLAFPFVVSLVAHFMDNDDRRLALEALKIRLMEAKSKEEKREE